MVLVLVAAIALALIHLTVGRVRVPVLPRTYWQGGAGGIAVAYVFVYLLPELAERQAAIDDRAAFGTGAVDGGLYPAALVGLLVFYGVERAARTAGDSDGTGSHDRAFWLHVVAFGLYNGFIGFLLHDQLAAGLSALAFFVAAIAPHLAVIEYDLQQHHEGRYVGLGQRLLAGAVVLGASVGYVVDIGDATTSLAFAFLAGGIVLNVFKEELPDEERSRFPPFAIAAVVFAALLALP